MKSENTRLESYFSGKKKMLLETYFIGTVFHSSRIALEAYFCRTTFLQKTYFYGK